MEKISTGENYKETKRQYVKMKHKSIWIIFRVYVHVLTHQIKKGKINKRQWFFLVFKNKHGAVQNDSC